MSPSGSWPCSGSSISTVQKCFCPNRLSLAPASLSRPTPGLREGDGEKMLDQGQQQCHDPGRASVSFAGSWHFWGGLPACAQCDRDRKNRMKPSAMALVSLLLETFFLWTIMHTLKN